MAIDTLTIQVRTICETAVKDIPTRVELAQTGCLVAGGSVQMVVFFPRGSATQVNAYATAGSIAQVGSCTFSRSEYVSFQGGCSVNVEYPTSEIIGGSWVGRVYEKYQDSGTEYIRVISSPPAVSLANYQLTIGDCTENPPEEFQCGGGGSTIRTGIFGVYSVTYNVYGLTFRYTAPTSFDGDVLVFFHLK